MFLVEAFLLSFTVLDCFLCKYFLKTNGFSQPGRGIFPLSFDLFFSNAGLALEQTSRAAAREA